MTQRDSDRAKVYSAEQSVRDILDCVGQTVRLHGSTIAVPMERKFGNIESIQTYVDQVLSHIGKPCGITVRKRKGNMAAHYETRSNVIAIPDTSFGRRESTVLHEVSHALSCGEGHNEVFRTKHVELVKAVMGFEAAFILQSAYFQVGLNLM